MDGFTLTADWDALLALRDAPGRLPDGPLGALFGPLLAPPRAADGCVVVGRLAQTLDGRIATSRGSSQWIGGPGDLLHTHRLRALCHAVVVGAGTVRSDDPRLTTRDCSGPHPVRVVLDTDRRLGRITASSAKARPPCCCAPRMRRPRGPGPDRLGIAEVLRLPRDPLAGGLQVPAILAALAARGLTRIFVEGGGVTGQPLPRRRLPRPAAGDRRAGAAGLGQPGLHPAGGGAHRRRAALAWYAAYAGPDMLFDIALDRARPGGVHVKATALWTVAPGHAELREEVLPPLAADQALVRTRASALSRGTESLVFEGRVPPSQYAVMRAPLRPAISLPRQVRLLRHGRGRGRAAALLGRRVFVLHPHQDRFLVPAMMCMPVPDAVPDHRAALAANMETALNTCGMRGRSPASAPGHRRGRGRAADGGAAGAHPREPAHAGRSRSRPRRTGARRSAPASRCPGGTAASRN